ncbi:MBL fold metallo-hydrolase [Prauserella oleivorans]|uniref:MBL fold metallo-hydrolase n=1 Tax=Prauserella oleivorans TaxID=1478153 RepID=A0ABW5WES8_9PSEU
MDLVELTPRLHLLRFAVGQAYLWRDGDGVTLVDTGPPGNGEEIARALEHVGASRGDLRRIVLTHFHGDHAGSVAEIRSWSAAAVHAHRFDAPIVRGLAAAPPPVLQDWERPLFDQVGDNITGPPAEVDIDLDDGDRVGENAHVLWIPGHTAGSMALYLPGERVLFTGDTIAEHGGEIMLGVFNQDRQRTVASLRRLAELDTDIACFGHGDPLVGDAATALRAAARY